MQDQIEQARAWFAEDLRVAAGIRTQAIVNAFAHVPRENFVGPPPWRMGMRMMSMGAASLEYQTVARDPCVLYHDVVVALDETQEINNGQPSLWAKVFEECQPRIGERILHLGCGTGYYTAVLAEIVGLDGSVHGVEIETTLAGRAADVLAGSPNVTTECGTGVTVSPESWDMIVVSAGATHPLKSWLAGLRPNGRLLFPLTADSPNPRSGNGAMILISRSGRGYDARFLTPASFVHFQGGRDLASALLQALRLRFHKARDVQSLRKDGHEEGESCWFHTETFCLSYDGR